MPEQFEYAILGAGAAGLSLALALLRSPLKGKSILVVDKDDKTCNDRTWCFWSDKPTPYDMIAFQNWERICFIAPGVRLERELPPFRYVMVRGGDFYEYAWQELRRNGVTFIQGKGEILDDEGSVIITVEDRQYRAAWGFDSRIRPEDIRPRTGFNYLKQHFLGWEVETQNPVFDQSMVTMFDLDTPQRNGITFYYTLPFSSYSALVEYTLFSHDLLPMDEYEQALRDHLKRIGAGEFQVRNVERGIIPMTDHPFPRRLGERILSIGTRGGRVKPSTGYAFSRIQLDSGRIVKSLLEHGHPFSIPADGLRHRIHDAIMLEILSQEPHLGRPIFSAIFQKNPIQRVLKFLDNRTSFLEDLPVMAAHEPGPFLKAILRKIVR